jgi:AcrR family transcriptional regulator
MMAGERDVRREILETSLALIEEEGLAALSLREVARRAGLSHQAPYHHFADREAILAALAEEGFASLATAMEEGTAAHTDPVARLAAAGRAYITFALTHPGHFRLMFRSELVDVGRHPAALEAGARAYQVLVDGVAGCVAAGRSGGLDADALVRLCWSLVHGAAGLLLDGPPASAVGEGQRSADEVVRAFVRLLDRA